MDESLQDLENELSRLSPRGLSPELLARLERELGPATAPVAPPAPAPRRAADVTSWSSWKWAGWSLAAAAAAVAVFFVVRSKPVAPAAAESPVLATTESTSSVDRYEPVRATSVLYDMKEDGPASLSDQTEGRQVRYRYVDTYTWRNPATKASLRWSVPRDEVRVIRTRID